MPAFDPDARGVGADFYDVPRHRLGELEELAKPNWSNLLAGGKRWHELLTSLRRPVPRHPDPNLYLTSALGVLGDTPLRDGQCMLGSDSPAYEDLLMELVESTGGGWEIIEPSPERLAALDASSFDVERLRAHYAGESDYYGDDDEVEEEPGPLGGLLDRVPLHPSHEVPADAGERIVEAIAFLRMALANTSDSGVLLIRMP